jgi:hypothetical protein
VRLRKVGAIALFWSGMPYLDLGRSPPKTLGRPTGRVKALCVPSCVPNAQESGGSNVSLCGNGSPELGRPPRSRTEPRPATWSVGWKGSRRTSLDRCDRRVWPDARGHRAGSPLISAIRSWDLSRGRGLAIMSDQSSAYAGWTRTLVAEPRMPFVTTFSTRSSGGFPFHPRPNATGFSRWRLNQDLLRDSVRVHGGQLRDMEGTCSAKAEAIDRATSERRTEIWGTRTKGSAPLDRARVYP